MHIPTHTSDLTLHLDESVVTDALATIGTEYIKLSVRGTPPAPIRAVLLYFDAGRRSYVLEQVGPHRSRVTVDCRRLDLPAWLGAGDGPEVIARLIAHEQSVVYDGPVQVDGALDAALVRSITPEAVDGIQFWGTVELALDDTTAIRRPPIRPDAQALLRVPATVIVAFTLVDLEAPTVALEIELAADHAVTFRAGDVFWGRRLDDAPGLREQIDALLGGERFRTNFEDAVRQQFRGDVGLELTGTFSVELAPPSSGGFDSGDTP